MPYPSKISREAIIAQARTMIEAAGVDKLSVNELAKALGVKTPSLYRYFQNDNQTGLKTEILREINEDTVARLYAALAPALADTGPIEERLLVIAHAYRDFAQANPLTYGLVYTNTIAALRPDEDNMEQGVLPIQAVMAEVSGEAASLPALRGIWALIHGFVMLELAEQFRRGGELDDAFEQSVRAYIAGWRRE